MSTVGDIMMHVEGYHEYRGGVQYCGGYHRLKFEYRGGYHETCGEIMSTVGDILSTMGVFSTVGDILSTMGCSVPWGIS